MKKKLLALFMASTFAFSLAACGAAEPAADAQQEAAVEETAAEEAPAKEAATQEAASEEAAAEETAAEETAATGEITGDGVATPGVLVMATNAEFPPYEFHEGDAIVGIDAEIAAAIAEKMGCTLEIEDIAFDSIIAEVDSGKADIGLAGMTVTEDRKKNVDFSDTYAHSSQVIIVPEDSEITSPDGLSGLIVGVQTGTTGDIYASDDDAIGGIERYSKGMEAVMALTQNKVDAVIIDRATAQAYLAEVTGLKIVDESYTDEDYAAAIKKGNTALLDNVNKALAELTADGTLDAIVAKYITAE